MEWLYVFGSGWNKIDGDWVWALSPSTYVKHRRLIARAKARTGRELRQNEGPSCYRSYAAQVKTRAYYESIGQPNLAAKAGTSSHGGKWEGIYTLAVDYGNWWAVYNYFGSNARTEWFADVRAVGLVPGMISPTRGYPDEPWHVIDLDPWAPLPAGIDVTDFPEEDMPITTEEIQKIAAAAAAEVWRAQLQALDANGQEVPGVKYSARGMLANVNGRIEGIKVPSPAQVWEYAAPVRTADNRVDPEGKTYPVQTMLANINAKADHEYANPVTAPSIDYEALAQAIIAAGGGQNLTAEQITQVVRDAILSIDFDITTS